jgi:hypothetical protein
MVGFFGGRYVAAIDCNARAGGDDAMYRFLRLGSREIPPSIQPVRELLLAEGS